MYSYIYIYLPMGTHMGGPVNTRQMGLSPPRTPPRPTKPWAECNGVWPPRHCESKAGG